MADPDEPTRRGAEIAAFLGDIDVAALEDLVHLADLPEECPYLKDRVSTLRFADGRLGAAVYRVLLDRGYRRNGNLLYRPVCRGCNACKVIRVPVDTFRRSREQRRVWNRCQGQFDVRIGAPEFTLEKSRLYTRYLAFQHGEESGKSEEAMARQYQDFLVGSCLGAHTIELQVYAGGTLAGVSILDRLGDALSAVYFYFAPEFSRYSLGTWTVLHEIELARRWGLRYYYLGHYIEECGSMNYKARFRPCEIKGPDDAEWQRYERGIIPRPGAPEA